MILFLGLNDTTKILQGLDMIMSYKEYKESIQQTWVDFTYN